MMPNESPTPDPRLERIEEIVSFSERAIEEIHDQLFAIHDRLDKLNARLNKLEQQAAAGDALPEPTGADGFEPDEGL